MKRVAIYTRVSSGKQERRGYSLESQVESIRKLIRTEGWQEAKVFREVYPGTQLNRPELDRLRDLVAEGDVDIVVAHDVDRLSRDPAHLAFLEREFEESGVAIRYVLLPDTDTPSGQLLKDVKAAIGRFENLQRVERSRRGTRRKVKEQKVSLGPHRPYGYRVTEEGTLEIDEEEAETVRNIYSWLVSDGLTICAIVRRLEGTPTKNDKTGVYPKRRRYGQWARSSVCYILKNETYVGRWYYGKHRSTGRKGKRGDKAKADYILCDPQPRETWLEVQVPPIISQEIFDAAQDMLARNKQMAHRNSKHRYLLSSLIFCECGRRMAGASINTRGKTYKYYRCTARTDYTVAGPTCPAYRVRADILDKAVWREIYKLLIDPQNLLQGLEEERRDQRKAEEKLRQSLDRTQRLVEEYDRKLDRLLDNALLADQFGDDMIAAKVKQLKDQRESLVAQMADIQSRIDGAFITEDKIQSVRQFAERVSTGLDVTSFQEKRRILKILAVRVDCDMLPGEDGRRIVASGCIPTTPIVTTKPSRNCTTRRRW